MLRGCVMIEKIRRASPFYFLTFSKLGRVLINKNDGSKCVQIQHVGRLAHPMSALCAYVNEYGSGRMELSCKGCHYVTSPRAGDELRLLFLRLI